MPQSENREVWLRGPIPGIPPLLQPVAHALLQAREEIKIITTNFPDHRLWDKPGGAASVGFHLQHLRGVLDRLFTYARAESLTQQQLNALAAEKMSSLPALRAIDLVQAFNEQVDKAIQQLSVTDEKSLLDMREVGRAKLPSNVLGLLVHAAEHTMRHVGQLLVTVKVLNQ